MKTEINAAVNFLVEKMRNAVQETLSEDQLRSFQNVLSSSIAEKFENHWYENKPLKGSAFRCIQIIPEEHYVHPLLKEAMKSVGVSNSNMIRIFGKGGISIWIDPFDVSCRLGSGAIFPVYRKISQSRQQSLSTEVRQHRPQQRPRSISPLHENLDGCNSLLRPKSTTPPGFSSVHAGQLYQNVATPVNPDSAYTSWNSASSDYSSRPASQSSYKSYSSGQLLGDSSFSSNQYSSYYQPKPMWKRNYRAKQKSQWQDQESYQRYHWSRPATSDDMADSSNDILSMQHLQEVY